MEVFPLLPSMRHRHYVIFPHCWSPLQPPPSLLVPLPAIFAHYSDIILKVLRHSHVVGLVLKIEQALCTVICFLSWANHRVLRFSALDPRMVSDLGVLVPLSSTLQQIIDDNGFLSIVNAFSFDSVLSYDVDFRSDEVDWSVIALSNQIMLYYFGAVRVHPMLLEVVASCKHVDGHRVSYQLLGPVPDGYRERPFLTLEEVAQFARDFPPTSGSSGLAGVHRSWHDTPADDDRMDYYDDCILGNLLTFGAMDSPSAIKATFERLCVACEQMGVTKPATMANFFAVAQAALKSQPDLPPWVDLVKWRT